MRDEVERVSVALAERRERIATAALQGLLANSSRCDQSRDFSRFAVNFADALIAALDKEEAKP